MPIPFDSRDVSTAANNPTEHSSHLFADAYAVVHRQTKAENVQPSTAQPATTAPEQVTPQPAQPAPEVTSAPQDAQTLVKQGLASLKAGDEKEGIVALMQAAEQNPQLVSDATFVQALRTAENQPAQGNDIFAPTTCDTSADVDYGNLAGDPSQLVNPALYGGGLNFLKAGDKVDGILYLMEAAVNNPQLPQDQYFMQLLTQVESAAKSQSNQTANNSDKTADVTNLPSISDITQQTSSTTEQPSDKTQEKSAATQVSDDTTRETTDTTQQATDTTQQATNTTTDSTISNEPRNDQTLLSEGMTDFRKGDFSDGIDDLLQVVQDNPSLAADPNFISMLHSLDNAAGSSL
jgi:hypothetical protein